LVVATGNTGDELVDAVLVRRQWAGPGVRRAEAALHRFARGPVLPIGQIPEVDGVGGIEIRLRRNVLRERPRALDVGAVCGQRCHHEYVIDGVKWHVTSYNLADYCFVQAVLVGGEFEGEHVLLVVDLPWPGVEVVRTPHYSHHIADEHPIVAFDGVRVPLANLVGAEGQGMTFTQDWFRFERMMVAARCVGAAQRLLDEATSFARERVVDGRPLGGHQLVAGMLADSATELFAARTMLYEVARSIDGGADRKTLHAQASMAKLYCSEMAGRVADRSVQIFGGRGYMRENVAERMYRELRVERIWEGASEIQRIIVARQLMNRGPAAVLEGR
jgi:alkylation response protein AidB-like acyl-CoA dehydrogenase